MTGADLLASLTGQGFTLSIADGGVKVSPAGRLTADQRQQIRGHKVELLVLLGGAPACRPVPPAPPTWFRRIAEPWDEAEASKVIAPVLALTDGPWRSDDPAKGRRQSNAAHAFDDAWSAKDLSRLRKATAAFVRLCDTAM
jgi:hypothetical protein